MQPLLTLALFINSEEDTANDTMFGRKHSQNSVSYLLRSQTDFKVV